MRRVVVPSFEDQGTVPSSFFDLPGGSIVYNHTQEGVAFLTLYIFRYIQALSSLPQWM